MIGIGVGIDYALFIVTVEATDGSIGAAVVRPTRGPQSCSPVAPSHLDLSRS
jgi:hypothetical protein